MIKQNIVYLFLACFLKVQGNQTCTTLGNDLMPGTGTSALYGLLINTVDTTNCMGNATAWNICYYNATSSASSTTQFGVYRPSSLGSTVYTPVPGSAVSYTIARGSSTYACSKYPIPQAQQFVVRYGDVIYACVQSQLFGGPKLGVVGSVSGHSVLHSNVISIIINPCASLSNTIDVSSGYTNSSGYALHVNLDVDRCAVSNGGCAQVCTNTSTGNSCSCSAGYQLDPSGQNCSAITSTMAMATTSTLSTAYTTVLSPTSAYTTVKNTAYTSVLDPTSASTPDQTSTTDILVSTPESIASAAIPVTATFSNSLVSPTSTSASNAGISPDTLPGGTVAAIVVVLLVVAVVTVGVFGTMISCRAKIHKRNRKCLVLGLPNAADFQNSSYRSLDREGDNPMYSPLVEDRYTNIQEGRSQYENLDANSCVSLYACIDEEVHHSDLGENESPYAVPPVREDELYKQLQRQKIKKINRQEIELAEELGRGQFGGVHAAVWRSSGGPPVEVAVKTMNAAASQQEDKIKFLQEAAIMAQFNHCNVIQLHGIVTERDSIMLVIELAQNKDLRTYLNFLKTNLSGLVLSEVSNQLLSCSQQVALGMQYLSTKAFVHRDLAARNVFVTKDLVCKIGDFGLSRNLDNENYYVSQGGVIPVRWTAPEAVHYKKYSSASDVWSYGCLLYEIWSVGHKPFEGRTNTEVIEEVDAGYRLPPPPGCPLHIYQAMIQCWNPDPYSRPKFRELHLSLAQYETHVSMIPNEALLTHPQAGVLGAPLKAGENMYITFQKSYLHT